MSKQNKRPANGAAPGADMPAMQLDMATVKRLLSYMSCYRGQLVLVVACILLSAIASAASSMFLQALIDDYIVPLLATDAPVWTGLAHALITIGAVLGYYIDRAVFLVEARPHQCIGGIHIVGAWLRRALIVLACVLGMTLGL